LIFFYFYRGEDDKQKHIARDNAGMSDETDDGGIEAVFGDDVLESLADEFGLVLGTLVSMGGGMETFEVFSIEEDRLSIQ
jgi:hypothetical protein